MTALSLSPGPPPDGTGDSGQPPQDESLALLARRCVGAWSVGRGETDDKGERPSRHT